MTAIVEPLLLSLIVVLLAINIWYASRLAKNQKESPSQQSLNQRLMELNQWQKRLESWEASLQERTTPSEPSSGKSKRACERSWLEL